MPAWGNSHADSRRSSWCSASLEGRGAGSIVATLYAQQEKLHNLELKLRQLQATPSDAAELPRNRGGGGVASFLEDVARRLDAVSDRLQALPVSQPARSAAHQREEMFPEVDEGFPDFAGIRREPPALRHTGLGSAPSWPEKAEDAWREQRWIEPVASQVHRPVQEVGVREANPSPLPQANQRFKAVPELPVAENIDRDVFLAMGYKAPQPRDVALPYDRQMSVPSGAAPATALPERGAGMQPQLSEPKEFGAGVFQAPARHAQPVQQTSSPLPRRSDVPQMLTRGCEWLEPVTTGAGAEPALQVVQSTSPPYLGPGRLPGQALLGEEPREFDPDVLWAK